MEGSTVFLLLFSLLIFHKILSAELETISDSQLLTDEDTLVSQTGIFELGLFRPGSSENRYLGIWYKKVSVRTVVWVANRDHPLVGDSPIVLKVADPGILVLLNNNSMIWSSNVTMKSRSSTAKLRDTGNLVLVDANEKVIWQSFDFPTDTLLPGMKLGRNLLTGMEWHLTSWKSSQDPALGELTWGAGAHGYPENKLKQGDVVKFRGGAWRNQRYTGVSQFNKSLTFVYNVVIVKSEVSFTYILENSTILSRVALNSSGQLESSVWVEQGKKWQFSLTLPRDICDTYNICSAYGICNVNTVSQSCVCLDEKRFVPRNEKSWDSADWTGGCVRRTTLDCKNGSEGFIKYSNVKLPDSESTWFNMSLTLKECEEKCLKNCTCMAYAKPDPSFKERGCVLWFEDLLDIRVYPEGNGGQDIFVRMASSELVARSTYKKKRRTTIKIMLLVVVPGAFLLGFISISLWYALRKRNLLVQMRGGESLHVSENLNHEDDIQLPLFSFATIATATGSFSTDNILGEGGFGTVYKGVLEDGLEIAVKRLSKTSSQGVNEFKNEVICVSELQHRNLVKLLGCCIQGDEKLLLYEYILIEA